MAETLTVREAGLVYTIDVDKVRLAARQPLVIERQGTPIAALVSFDEYRRFAAWQLERMARRVWVVERDPYRALSAEEWRAQFEAMDRFAVHFEAVSSEELEAEISGALAAVRAEEQRTRRSGQ
jgi:antitoxin (DNA-binding transcriptional repressor) of toxin-antitoxin stability system